MVVIAQGSVKKYPASIIFSAPVASLINVTINETRFYGNDTVLTQIRHLLRNLKLINGLHVNLETQLFRSSDHVVDDAFLVFFFIIQGA